LVNQYLETGYFVNKGNILTVKRLEFISDKMSYITLNGRWCDFVLNVQAPTEDRNNDTKGRFTTN